MSGAVPSPVLDAAPAEEARAVVDGVGRDEGPPSYAWIFLRLSGVLLVGLIGLHVAYRYLVNDVGDVTALTMVSRWDDPWWRLADFALVVLATAHTLIGLHGAARRRWCDGTVRLVVDGVVAVVLVTLGMLAAWTVLTVGS